MLTPRRGIAGAWGPAGPAGTAGNCDMLLVCTGRIRTLGSTEYNGRSVLRTELCTYVQYWGAGVAGSHGGLGAGANLVQPGANRILHAVPCVAVPSLPWAVLWGFYAVTPSLPRAGTGSAPLRRLTKGSDWIAGHSRTTQRE